MNKPIQGLTTIQSQIGPKQTMDLLEAEVRAQGMKVFARIDHGALAAEVGMTLRPTEVLLFGNPRAGTPLMQSSQPIGIDLPLKVLVWQDESSQTWFSYEEPSWLATRHGVGGLDHSVTTMSLALAAIATKVTGSI